MKTTRDIKSSLEVARKRKAQCRTIFIEDKLKKELEDVFGDILSEDERAEIEEKERRRINAYNLALRKSKMKILRQKEKGMIVQELRSGKDPKGENVGRIAKKEIKPKESEKKVFNEIELEY